MSDLWEPCQFNDKSHVYCEPPSKLDAIYDDLLLKVTGNMLVEQKIEVAKMICNQLNENTALREQIAAKDEAYDILAIHMAEVKAFSDGNSTNTLKVIVDHCLDELAALKGSSAMGEGDDTD